MLELSLCSLSEVFGFLEDSLDLFIANVLGQRQVNVLTDDNNQKVSINEVDLSERAEHLLLRISH